MNIRDMQTAAYSTAVEKGWHERPLTDDDGTPSHDAILAKLALIHSEVSEATEAVRVDDWDLRFDENGKPEGLPAELADVLIRIGDLCGALGINLEAAVTAKMAFNRSRSHRHGGKSA